MSVSQIIVANHSSTLDVPDLNLGICHCGQVHIIGSDIALLNAFKGHVDSERVFILLQRPEVKCLRRSDP